MERTTDGPSEPLAAEGRASALKSRPAPFKGVIIGLAVDQIGSVVSTFLLIFVYDLTLLSKGVDPRHFQRVVDSLRWSSWLNISEFAVAFLFSALAGYICGRLARRRVYQTALIMAILDTGISLGVSYKTFDVQAVALNGVMVVAILTGAWLWRSRSRQ